jgi:hypothetical protein
MIDLKIINFANYLKYSGSILKVMAANIRNNWTFDAEYNGKEEGCGELILNLFIFFKPLKPGTRVCVTAHIMGAQADIEVWCKSTKHILLESHPPYFLIEKKQDAPKA